MTDQVKENEANNMENDKKMEENNNNQEEIENNVEESENTDVEQPSEEDANNKVELLNKIEDLQDRLLRSQADFENYKKRTRVEKEYIAKYANTKLIEGLLPAIDNFSRAIQSSKESENLESLVQGVKMVYRQIDEILTKEGLEVIQTVGQPFNPELHQAVMQVETDEYESGVVVEELQKGYLLKGKVIRPSMVKVNT